MGALMTLRNLQWRPLEYGLGSEGPDHLVP
jgi:hypothetical protein